MDDLGVECAGDRKNLGGDGKKVESKPKDTENDLKDANEVGGTEMLDMANARKKKTKKAKKIEGIPYILYRISHTKKTADSVARQIRDYGYYVRVIESIKGYEIWVSKNPRWFYALEKFHL